MTTPWVDLALNKPGAAARAQAREERDKIAARVTGVGAWVLRVLDDKTDERAWRIGADGEERVGRLLDKATKKGFRALHAVPVGDQGSDIDHVLIGPPGVFTINTKTHPGANIWVRGNTIKVSVHNLPYVRNSRFEAQRAARLLAAQLGWEPPVTGVVVFNLTKGARLTVKEQPADVLVRSHEDVPRWFIRQPALLTPEQVNEVYEVARRSTTWVA